MNQCRIRKDDSDMDPGKGIAYTVPHGSGNICATSRHTDKEKEGVGGGGGIRGCISFQQYIFCI